jgi:hypothetical protein
VVLTYSSFISLARIEQGAGFVLMEKFSVVHLLPGASRVVAACLLLAAGAFTAAAAEARQRTLVFDVLPKPAQSEADKPQSCLFISHDCEVCALDAMDQPVCSSTGIACVSTERRCYRIEETVTPE